MKKHLFLTLCCFCLAATALSAELEESLAKAIQKAQVAQASDFKNNPLLSLRAYATYEMPQGSNDEEGIGVSMQCNALLYSFDGMVLLDKPCTKLIQMAFKQGESVNLMFNLSKFGFFVEEGKRQPYYYMGYNVGKGKISFYGPYARFWIPIHSRSLLLKTSRLRFPKLPQISDVKNIFSSMPPAVFEKFKNTYYNPFVHSVPKR